MACLPIKSLIALTPFLILHKGWWYCAITVLRAASQLRRIDADLVVGLGRETSIDAIGRLEFGVDPTKVKS